MTGKWKETTEPESIVEMAEAEMPAEEAPKPKRKPRVVEVEKVVICEYCSKAAGRDVPITPDPKGIHACQCRLPNPPED